MTEDLLETLRDIIESDPLDIYSSEEDSITECVFELVESRYEEDNNEEEDRYIGSANILIASSLLIYVLSGMKDLDKISEIEEELYYKQWEEILLALQNEKFIRPTKLTTKESIKVVVDNTADNVVSINRVKQQE